MELYINAFAHYLPDNRVPNSYFKDVNGLDDEWIRTRTGISTRSKAGENENTNTMALEAVKRLHEKLPFPIEEVDLIVAATYSPHDTVATAAHMIQRHFKARAARCLTVSAACSSFINAMEIVEGYFAMNKATKAIVVASEHNTEYSNETCPQSGHLWQSPFPPYRKEKKQPVYLIYLPADSDTSAKQTPPFTYAHITGVSVCRKGVTYLSMPAIT